MVQRVCAPLENAGTIFLYMLVHFAQKSQYLSSDSQVSLKPQRFSIINNPTIFSHEWEIQGHRQVPISSLLENGFLFSLSLYVYLYVYMAVSIICILLTGCCPSIIRLSKPIRKVPLLLLRTSHVSLQPS